MILVRSCIPPLLLARSRNLFKLFQNDVGLLAAQYANGIQLRIILGDDSINMGSIYENAIAQELTAHGYTPYYYNNKKKGEIDFIIEQDGKVLPIEVKSGKEYQRHHGLVNVMNVPEYAIDQAIVFSHNNVQLDGRILYAPIYMVMFITKENGTPSIYKVDLSTIQ
jgi:predicted AAA+ superfamily ATPase